MKKMLIVYYSWSCGNTKRIAEELAAATGADLTRIETVVPYPADYNTTVSQGQDEVERGYLPPVLPTDKFPSDYEVIAVGTPTWWYTCAPAVRSFLAEYDWSGKTVIPFMTNGGWPGSVIRDLKQCCRGAAFACPMEVTFDSDGGDRMVTGQEDVDAWIRKVQALL